MPTVIDSWVLQLGFDASEFKAGLRDVEDRIKKSREDYEKNAKAFTATVAGLTRAVGYLAAAWAALEVAIDTHRFKQFAENTSRTTTEFGLLAQQIGISVEQLSKWTNAANAAGGSGDELAHAFAEQQRQLQDWQHGRGNVPSFFVWMNQLGMHAEDYYDKEKKLYDIERMNLDIATNLTRFPGKENLILSDFGVTSGGTQSIYRGGREGLAEALRKQEAIGVVTQKNLDAARRLTEAFTNMHTVLRLVGLDILTYLEKPLKRILDFVTEALTRLREWQLPDWVKKLVDTVSPAAPGATPAPSPETPVTDELRRRGVFRFLRGEPSAPPAAGESSSAPSTAAPVESAPSNTPVTDSVFRWMRRWRMLPGSASPSEPAPEAPAPSEHPNSGHMWPGGNVYQAEPPKMQVPQSGVESGADDKHPPSDMHVPLSAPGPESRLRMLNYPKYAMNQVREGGGGTYSYDNSQTHIGAIHFESGHTYDTDIGYAPQGTGKSLSQGVYAVHANQSLE